MMLTFELKKHIFNKKFFILSTLLIVCVLLLFSRNFVFQSYIPKEQLQEIDNYIKTSQKNGTQYEEVLKNEPNNEEIKQLQKLNYMMINILYDWRNTRSSNDWKSNLQLENDFLTVALQFKELGGDFPLSQTEMNRTITFNEKLLELNIKPEHENYSIALPNFLKNVIDLLMNFGAFILIILFIGDTLSSEYENRTANLLYTQPLNKANIINAKFITSIFVYLISVLLIIIITFITTYLFGKKGTFSYPVMIERNQSLDFISIGDYILQGMTIVTCLVLLLISLLLFFSLLVKHTLTTIFLVMVTFALGYMISLINWNILYWVNPFQYLLASDKILIQNEYVWYQGIPSALLITMIFYIINIVKIKSSRVV